MAILNSYVSLPEGKLAYNYATSQALPRRPTGPRTAWRVPWWHAPHGPRGWKAGEPAKHDEESKGPPVVRKSLDFFLFVAVLYYP
jgi:hypothetical protein